MHYYKYNCGYYRLLWTQMKYFVIDDYGNLIVMPLYKIAYNFFDYETIKFHQGWIV